MGITIGGEGVIFGRSSADALVYSSTATQVTGFHSTTFVNRLTGLDAGETINEGDEFTINTVSTYDRVVIPEEGNYQVTFATMVEAINATLLSTARLRLKVQLKLEREQTITDIGSPGDIYARGNWGSSLASGSTEAEGVLALLPGDQIWAEYQSYRDSANTSATIDTQISIIKLQAGQPGEKGETGAQGGPGPAGAIGPKGDIGSGVPSPLGTAGQVVTVNAGETEAEWADPPDTHPDISFVGFPDFVPIYDEVEPQAPGFQLYRDNSVLSITIGTPTASTFSYTATTTTGLTATVTSNLLDHRVDVDEISLNHSQIDNGGHANLRFVFTLLGDDGNTFQLRRDIGFQRVDTDTFGTDDQDADEVDTDATQFSGNLSSTDTDVQTALETVDGLSLVPTGGDENRVVGYDAAGSFDVGRLVGTDILYWPDRDADIAEGTIAINSGGRVFVARQGIETDDDDYDTDPDANTPGARTRWEATHLQNTHGYIDGNEFIIVFGERNNLNAVNVKSCLLYTSPSPRDRTRSRMPSSA